MTGHITRRAFLVGIAGAAAAGWVWVRDRGRTSDVASATSNIPPPTTVAPATAPSTSVGSLPPPAPPTTTAAPPTTTAGPTTTTTVPAIQIEALCRDAWGAAAPTGKFREHTIERMTVHHTARPLLDNREAPAAIRGHQRFHQLDRGWPDIAYHFIIDLEGNVYEGRPLTAVGDTATSYDPTGHFLVSCEGDFESQEFPSAQQEALVQMLAWAALTFSVDPSTIRGHRDLAATTCPGDNLYALIGSGTMEREVRTMTETYSVELEVLCGEEALARVEAIET